MDTERQETWQERYESGNPGWDTGEPDNNLIEIVTQRPIVPCKTLEVGSGTGTNAVWLARQGFAVTGMDIVESATEKARERAKSQNLVCDFHVGDFLSDTIPNAPFEFVFDRGCFHSFPEQKEKIAYAKRVAEHLEDDGLWLSLLGNADDPPRDTGPPRVSALEIVSAVEPCFEVLSMVSTFFQSRGNRRPRAWSCLMKKRG